MTDMQLTNPRISKKKYNLEEFLEFTKNKEERYELIDGRIYMMASPSVGHQDISGYIYRKLGNYLEGKICRPFIAPLDVVLFKKDKKKSQNVFQPDVFVVCDPKKISKDRIYGAPDLIFEVVSPSSKNQDYLTKFEVYMKHGVKEYWIINPETKQITVYIKTKEKKEYNSYTFEDKISVGIFEDLEIDMTELRSV